MSKQRYAIVGASHSGVQLAADLRRLDAEAEIVLFEGEQHLPYQKPPLSKEFMLGKITSEKLPLRHEPFYEKQQIDLRLGTAVKAIDSDNLVIQTASGASQSFDAIALATGARVRRLSLPGSDLSGIHYLRTLDDSDQIIQSAQSAKQAVVVGAGFIGLEIAAALRQLDIEVKVLEALPRILERVSVPEVSEFFMHLHKEHGVDIMTNKSVDSFAGETQVASVRCDDGSEYPADLVVVGIGVIPNTELAEQAGIACDNGILVDFKARTSKQSIYAIGDCARFKSLRYQTDLRLESIQNATDMAMSAAKGMTGDPTNYTSLPWFWSNQYDCRLQIAGLSQAANSYEVEGDPTAGDSLVIRHFKDGRLIALDALNNPRAYMEARKQLANVGD